jgi:putative membrane protein
MGAMATTTESHDDERDESERDPLVMSKRLVYYAAERTLTSWIRTALSLMALGFVIARFGLIERMMPTAPTHAHTLSRVLSDWAGSIFIGLGVVMALGAGLRYMSFSTAYHRERTTRVHHGIFVGAVFSLLLATFGIVLIVLVAAIFE